MFISCFQLDAQTGDLVGTFSARNSTVAVAWHPRQTNVIAVAVEDKREEFVKLANVMFQN